MPRIIYDIHTSCTVSRESREPPIAVTSGKPYTVEAGEKASDWGATVHLHWYNPHTCMDEEINLEGNASVIIPLLKDALEQLEMMHEDFVQSGDVVPKKAKSCAKVVVIEKPASKRRSRGRR